MAVVAAAALTAVAACGGGGDKASGAPDGADAGGPSPASCQPGAIVPGRAPLRRLTAAQYRNSLRDLFPDVTLPALTLPAENIPKGYDDNADVQAPSPVLVEAYRSNAVAVTAAAFGRSAALPCGPTQPGFDANQCGADIVSKLGKRIFRRPLAPDEQASYAGLFHTELAGTNFGVAAQLVLQAMLQSPEFLYLAETSTSSATGSDPQPLGPYELASRLSYFLWNSIPDDALLAAADASQLGTPELVEAQARRMLADARARDAVANFHQQWLDYKRLDAATKDPSAFPGWSNDVRSAMHAELDKFVGGVIFDDDATLRSLFTSSTTYVNATLAPVYGVSAPADGSWSKVTLDPTQRAGFFTLSGMLAGHAHADYGSPVQRGVFVEDRVLCSPLPPPPPNTPQSVPNTDAANIHTNRDRFEAHVTSATCAGCHTRLDGIGFTFENFDAIGQYRTTDNGYPVDASGQITGSDVDGDVSGPTAVAQRLATSKQAHACVTTQWFRYAMARDNDDADACTLAALDTAFRAKGDNIRDLLVTLVTSKAFTHRMPGQ